MPRTTGHRLFFEVMHFKDFLNLSLSANYDKNYVGSQWNGWSDRFVSDMVKALGLDELQAEAVLSPGFLRSQLSWQEKHKGCVGETWVEYGPAFCLAPMPLFWLLLQWSRNLSSEHSPRALALLRSFLSRALPDTRLVAWVLPHDVSYPLKDGLAFVPPPFSSQSKPLQFHGPLLHLRSVAAAFPWFQKAWKNKFEKGLFPGETVDLSDFLKYLSGKKIVQCSSLLCQLLQWCSLETELSPWFKSAETDHIKAPILIGQGGRVRRIPEAYKTAVVAEGGAGSVVRSGAAFANMVRRFRMMGQTCGASTANQWQEQEMAKYLYEVRRHCSESACMAVSFAWDGSTLSFQEMIYMAMYLSRKAFWCPPIVPNLLPI